MICLHEGGGAIRGPFKGRKDAERLITLMELCGENGADTEVLEEDPVHSTAGQTERIY
jgi:hypothetical protein